MTRMDAGLEEVPMVADRLTVHEAARRCGVSAETIRRRLKAGRLPEAVLTEEGWRIPVTGLIADGFCPVSPRGLAEREAAEHPPQAPAMRVRPAAAAPADIEAVLSAQSREIDALKQLVNAQRQHISDLRHQFGLAPGEES
jgi:excisionase family DNA binding protein